MIISFTPQNISEQGVKKNVTVPQQIVAPCTILWPNLKGR